MGSRVIATAFAVFPGLLLALSAGPARAENYQFVPAPHNALNRVYRIDRLNGEVVACTFAVADDKPQGLTLCYPAGEGAKPGSPGDYALVASNHREEAGIYRVDRRAGTVSVCYVREESEVVCTPPAK